MPEEKVTINPTEKLMGIMRKFDALKVECVNLIDILIKNVSEGQQVDKGKKKDGSTSD